MKIKRYKKVHRSISFYTNNFGFRKPYQVLVDGTFCFAARKEQINIKDQIPKYLMGEVKLLTTRCVVLEAERIAKKAHTALTVLKQYGIHRCGHEEPVTGAACLTSMIGDRNKNHYFIATQDRALQINMRNVPGVPLLYFHNKTPVLDAVSDASNDFVNTKLSSTAAVSKFQSKTLKELKENSGLTSEVELKTFKKKKKRGPNPLSMKKKKKKNVDNSSLSIKSDKVKKRKRIKIAAHIKEHLKSVK